MKHTTQHFLVTIRSDGRYANDELAAHIAGRCWNIDGVIPHGADATSIATTDEPMSLLPNVAKAGAIVISTDATGLGGVQVIQWNTDAPPMAVGDKVWLQKGSKP